MKKERIVLSGAILHTEQGELKESAIVIEQGCIQGIISKNEIKSIHSAYVMEFSENYHIVPGFIDMHIHGTSGRDVMDADFDALKTIAETIGKQGTTSFLATTMTASPSEIENVLCHVRDYRKRQENIKGAKILGVHLEGPFISPEKAGAQCREFTLSPDTQLIEMWQKRSQQSIKLVTLAPELENSHAFIQFLRKKNIIPAIGHTAATFDETLQAIEQGCTHATHLFNAMSGLHHREPGAAGAILISPKVTAELIVDGIHVHPAVLQLTFQTKGVNQLVLVTDAMRAACQPDGEYTLGGQTVIVKKGVARLDNNLLAGSTLTLSEAVKNMLQFTHCSIADIVKMTSENPAKTLGIFDRKGSIACGKDADVVVLTEQGEVVLTICGGRIL